MFVKTYYGCRHQLENTLAQIIHLGKQRASSLDLNIVVKVKSIQHTCAYMYMQLANRLGWGI